jgi:tRNA modification GTPase
MDIKALKSQGNSLPALEISALKRTNLEKLKELCHNFFVPTKKKEEEVVLHLRQKILLEEILSRLTNGKNLLENGHPEEVYAEEIKRAIPLIGQMTGEIRSDEVINNIFSRFCVGK